MATTLDDFPARVTRNLPPMSCPASSARTGGVSKDLDEEVRRERDADVDAYHEWQGRYSIWLSNPNGQPQPY